MGRRLPQARGRRATLDLTSDFFLLRVPCHRFPETPQTRLSFACLGRLRPAPALLRLCYIVSARKPVPVGWRKGFCRSGSGECLTKRAGPLLKTASNGSSWLKDSLAKYAAEAILRLMRKRFEVQLALGRTPIERVMLPVRSRDELPPVLAGLQWIFQTPELNGQIFELLEKKVVGDKEGHRAARFGPVAHFGFGHCASGAGL